MIFAGLITFYSKYTLRHLITLVKAAAWYLLAVLLTLKNIPMDGRRHLSLGPSLHIRKETLRYYAVRSTPAARG